MLYAEPGHAVSVRFGGRPQRGRDARQRGAGRAAVGPSERGPDARRLQLPCEFPVEVVRVETKHDAGPLRAVDGQVHPTREACDEGQSLGDGMGSVRAERIDDRRLELRRRRRRRARRGGAHVRRPQREHQGFAVLAERGRRAAQQPTRLDATLPPAVAQQERHPRRAIAGRPAARVRREVPRRPGQRQALHPLAVRPLGTAKCQRRPERLQRAIRQ
mmetsp:Transcript_25100/g.70514  ORF Transcript_25100/g.70514 Transcript_25100/m.70514 type:complete len:217 (+) Transcript_25100:263-913(+)